jgi:hypothetical protein
MCILLTTALFPTPPAPGELLSTVARLVLQTRLREVSEVKVDVDSSTSAILAGGVDGVRVRGRRWCTPMKLSCSLIDIRVGRTAVDPSALITQRRIVLKRPALGSAELQFSASDWDNFLLHPLMRQQVEDCRRRSPVPKISFGRPQTRVLSPGKGDGGSVEFSYSWDGQSMRARLKQASSDGRVVVVARPLTSEGKICDETRDSASAGLWLARLFENLVLDLDGCELRFQELSVAETVAGPSAKTTAELALKLDVRVRSFPSLDINF